MASIRSACRRAFALPLATIRARCSRHGFFGHDSVDGTAFSDRIRRHYTNRGWRFWSVGEALLASQGQTIDAHQVVEDWLESRRTARSSCPRPGRTPASGRSSRPPRQRVRRCGDDRRHRGLRAARGEARRLEAAMDVRGRDARSRGAVYAASVWIGVCLGSISVANPRSQVTKTWPCSSIWSTIATVARAQAGVVARCLDELDPRSDRDTCADPSREELAPCASIRGISVSRRQGFTLPASDAAGLTDRSTNIALEPADRSELDGLGSVRRHRIARPRPSHDEPRRPRATTTSRRGGLVRRVLSSGPSPEERLEQLLAQRRASSRSTPRGSTSRSPSSSDARSSSATLARRSSGCSVSGPPSSRRASPS